MIEEMIGVFVMIRTFIEVPLFTKRWKEIGLSDDDLRELQIMLVNYPDL